MQWITWKANNAYPCGFTVCEKDLKSFFNNEEVFKCFLCDDEHQQPKNGFPSNKNVQEQLEVQVNQLDLSKNHPKYDECKIMFREIEENIKKTDLIQKDPENSIESIKKARDDCLSGNNKTNMISAAYETMKENLRKMNLELNRKSNGKYYKGQFNSFERNETNSRCFAITKVA